VTGRSEGRPPGLPSRRWLGRRGVAPLAAAFLAMVLAASIVVISPDAHAAWLWEALQRTARSLAQATIALVLFLLLVGCLIAVLKAMYAGCGGLGPRFGTAAGLLLAVIVGLNSAPIVVYVQALRSLERELGDSIPAALPLWFLHGASVVVALLAANAMIYYFFGGFVSTLLQESRKLYVASARFKGSTLPGYLAERGQMYLLGILGPLLVYLLSFTVFTDLGLKGAFGADETGIVQTLFQSSREEGMSDRFVVFLLVLMSIVLLIWAGLDVASTALERRFREGRRPTRRPEKGGTACAAG